MCIVTKKSKKVKRNFYGIKNLSFLLLKVLKTMKKTASDEFRDYLNGLVGVGRPFRSRVKLAEYLGLIERPKQSKLFSFMDGADSAFSTIAGWLERLGGKVIMPKEDIKELASYRFVPKVAAIAGAGATLETSDEILGYYAFRADWMGMEHVSERNSVLMDVRGDSMEPLLKDGDTLLLDQSDTEILDGRIYVVTLGDELRVKRIQKSMRGYVLRSENPRYADITVEGEDLSAFKVHGRVRWCAKML